MYKVDRYVYFPIRYMYQCIPYLGIIPFLVFSLYMYDINYQWANVKTSIFNRQFPYNPMNQAQDVSKDIIKSFLSVEDI